MQWIEVLKPAPVLNTPNFSAVFSKQGHPEAYEFVALPGMQFKVMREGDILQIEWPDYNVKPLYIDRRFVQSCIGKCENAASIPSAKELLSRMEQWVGASYVWGGNWVNGIPEMLQYYPPTDPLDSRAKILWTLEGVDCSGLLFQASGGATPRNTSQLVHFGNPVDTLDELIPMDMIVYPGHVLFVRDQKTVIESRSPFGVCIFPLAYRLQEIMAARKFVKNWVAVSEPSFTVRRFTA